MDQAPHLHHIGLVTENAVDEASNWIEMFGYKILTPLTHDPVQRVNIMIIGRDKQGDLPIELVEPVDQDSPIGSVLKKGGGFYHMCYEVDNVDKALSSLRDDGGIVLQDPVGAAAFENRRIAWCYTRYRRLFEYLERSRER